MSTPQAQLRELNPTQLIVLMFVAASLIGGILKLTFATHGGISFIDALFIPSSAVHCTGHAVAVVASSLVINFMTLMLTISEVWGNQSPK